jgi:type II secretory pathway pseudopilin PulG
MCRPSKRRAITLLEVLVVLFAIAGGIALLFPLISRINSGANRNHCFNRVMQLALATHNYQFGNRRFPLVCFNQPALARAARDCRPGDATGGPRTTGYSWIVALLPHIGEATLYKSIENGSQNFSVKTGPFAPAIVDSVASGQHASCVQLSSLVCPSWNGDGYTNSNTTIDVGASGGAPAGYGASEYATVGAGAFRGKVAVTNYKVMVGTHMRDGVPVENGAMCLTGSKGFTEQDFLDNTSRTILICETKESSYASWYDGTLNWLVGNDPNKPAPGNNDKPPWTGASISIQRGFNPSEAGSVPYLKKTLTANAPQNDVWWGPSSDHMAGITAHGYADGHILGVTDQCDPATYLSLISRADGERIDDTKIQ